MNLFLDIDGVILGKRNPRDIERALAGQCEQFIDYVLENFDCYWLTTHCQGDLDTVIDYLRPYSSQAMLDKFKLIRPTHYRTLKTEALQGDYIWIDDAPLICEIDLLSSNNQLNRWLEIDTQKDYFALIKLMPLLESFIRFGCNKES
ncbi:MAG: hypothetical protein KAT90_02445 [Gammaproteobacteria bacterium]|nr:hypothetical protein [Gammaproteobacteria bacterium]